MTVVAEFTCSLCWERFDSAVALMEHETQEDDRLYDLGDAPC